MIRFSNDEMVKASKNIRAVIKNGNGLPKSIKMTDTEGNSRVVDKRYYNGLFEARNVFILKNNRFPRYVTLNSASNNPLVIDYQNLSTTCGPTSLSMATQMLYSYISEQKCASACKTGSHGTSPANLIAGASSLGYKLTQIPRNLTSVKNAINKACPVIAHIETGGNTKPGCLGYTNNYGHYILIYGVSSDKYLIADPTKGIKKCEPSRIDKATNGRTLGYYKVGIL